MGFFGLSRIVQSRRCQSKYDGLAGRINRCPPDQDPMILRCTGKKGTWGKSPVPGHLIPGGNQDGPRLSMQG